MKLKGIFIGLSEVKKVGAYPAMKKRHLLIQTEEEHTNNLIFDILENKVNIFDGIALHSTIEIEFKITGKPWKKQSGEIINICNFICYNVKEITPVLETGYINLLKAY